jgi:DNA processing protein
MYKFSSALNYSSELHYSIAITLLPGIGYRTARKIIRETGSAQQFFRELKSGRVRRDAFPSDLVKQSLSFAEREIEQFEKYKIRALHLDEPEFPRRINACDDGPIVLYTKGEMDLNSARCIAIVGTRNATSYGIRVTKELVEHIARYKGSVISGLAYGIDTAAHRAANEMGVQNVGVVAHGLDKLYPSSNATLARKMERFGGLVSDFKIGTLPDRTNFPMRNRIIAGLCDATIVVEAGTKGGALITAKMANAYNRDVFAVPGRHSDAYSSGCNLLVRNNEAAILASASDLAWHLGWEEPELFEKKTTGVAQVKLDENETILLSLIRKGVNSLDTICDAVDLQHHMISAALLSLEFKKLVRSLPGKTWEATGNG